MTPGAREPADPRTQDRDRAPGDATEMRVGTAVSVVLHGTILGFLVFGLPLTLTPPAPVEQVVPVDLVTVKEKVEAPKPPPPRPDPPKPAPPKQEAKLEPPPPPPQAKPEPPPPPPPPKPAEAKPEAPKAEPKKPDPPKPAPVAKKEPPKPKEPAPKKPEPERDDFAVLMDRYRRDQTPPPRPANAPQLAAVPPASAISLADQVTTDEKSRIVAYYAQCWNFDPGIRGVQDMEVEIDTMWSPDGRLLKADFDTKYTSRIDRDPGFNSFAQSAKRAVLRCQSPPLPQGKFEGRGGWNRMIIKFNPREMFG